MGGGVCCLGAECRANGAVGSTDIQLKVRISTELPPWKIMFKIGESKKRVNGKTPRLDVEMGEGNFYDSKSDVNTVNDSYVLG